MDAVPPPMPQEGCKACGNPPEENYRIPLCSACRTTLANRPLPVWIKILAGAVALVLAYAIARVPSEISAGIAFERGRKAEAAGDYASAATRYKQVVDRFPDSTLAVARLGISQFRNHDMSGAAKTLSTLRGREASREITTEVNGVIDEMNKENR